MAFTRASTTTHEPRRLDTVIWYPAAASGNEAAVISDANPATDGAPFPVVVFSHGDGNDPRVATYFTEHLASWGFVVVAPPHPGDTSADCTSPCGTESRIDSALNRVDDLTFALDQVLALQNDPANALGRIVDPTRTAVTGHSFGGWTALAAEKTGRFDAVVAMAPAPASSLLQAAAAATTPTLIAVGGEDDVVPPPDVRALYDAFPPSTPHYYLFLPQAGHHAFRDICSRTCDLAQVRAHDLVNGYVTAFLEVDLLHDERFRPYLSEDQPPDATIAHAAPVIP